MDFERTRALVGLLAIAVGACAAVVGILVDAWDPAAMVAVTRWLAVSGSRGGAMTPGLSMSATPHVLTVLGAVGGLAAAAVSGCARRPAPGRRTSQCDDAGSGRRTSQCDDAGSSRFLRLADDVLRRTLPPVRGALHIGAVHLDGLRTVADIHGPRVAGAVLELAAARLAREAGPADAAIATPIGLDELGVCIPAYEPARASGELLAVLSEPFVVDGRELYVEPSMGLARVDASTEASEVLHRGRLALGEAQRRPSAAVEFYDRAVQDSRLARMELEGDVRRALARRELFLEFQPCVDAESGVVSGFEALLRWQHPKRGAVSPAEFVPIAEATGAIVEIGQWVLQQACAQAAQWSSLADGAVTMSVNVSPVQLAVPGFVDHVAQALASTGVQPGWVVLELTESALLDHQPALVHTLNRLRALGVRIAIDDFGTGYSGLGYLQWVPVDILKIDKRFVDELGANAKSEALVGGIVKIARELGIKPIAEGVERADQARALLSLGCGVHQGYLYSRPLCDRDAETLLRPAAMLGAVGSSC